METPIQEFQRSARGVFISPIEADRQILFAHKINFMCDVEHLLQPIHSITKLRD
jgi:hypothetical protein